MLKRSLVFENPVILRLKDNQLVVSFKELPDEKRTIPIEDIGFVLINHPMVSISMSLLNELASNNIAVVFCDEKGLPQSMLLNFDSNLTQGKIISEQLVAGEVLKKNLWRQIIVSKIKNQSLLLNKDRPVRVLDPKGDFEGTARGINEKGELLVERQDGRLECVYAGEVSVRGVYGYV